MKFPLILVALLTLPSVSTFAQRQTLALPDGWKFLKHDAAPDAAVSDEWQAVSVPHCWNAFDGQDGKAAEPNEKEGYYRGPVWYVRALDVPAAWKDRRVFIRFGAAFLVADVYLNGEHLGQHRGGFAAFCYELTDKLRFGAPNELRVRVDNATNPDVAPLSGDFTKEGGIYRPVELLVTDRVCITPLDNGGPGVYVTPLKVAADRATVEVETKFYGADPTEANSMIVTIRDANGNDVTNQIDKDLYHENKQRFRLDHPHLWNGIKDPYLYSVEVSLVHFDEKTRIGTKIDSVTVPLGLRTVAIDNDKGFLLNGQPYPIHGVNRHQEKRDQGWALSDADHDADFQTMREMGVTAVRLAHYQQAEHVHDLADRTGILLWQEIPVVDYINPSDAFADNCKQQLTEMIRQGYNHPSIFTWSVYNELVHPKSAPPEKLVTELDRLARELDPTRTPTCASCHPDLPALDRITPWIGFNIYPGWYVGTSDAFGPPEDFERNVKKSVAAAGGGKRVAISEYGAGANPAQHQEGTPAQVKPNGAFHPEEWQAHVHEVAWSQARNNPDLWGTFIWCMFDFASDGRNEGSNPGVNDKGMVTEDRQIKKDAFYFYKANWNPEPMVYLTGRRAAKRTQAQTEVKAYSNCDEAQLVVNGQNVGAAKPDEVHVCRWPGVTLKPGANRLEVVARAADGRELRDGCEWTLEAAGPVNP